MKPQISKTQAREKIETFFQKEDFTSEEARKIKRLAMKFNIKLGEKRKLFCKKCLSRLKGKTRITKNYKTIKCENCGYLNKFRLAGGKHA